MLRNSLSVLAFACALLLGIELSHASSLQIGPIRIQMIGPERTTTLTVRNTGANPITAQIRAVDWTQDESGDNYAPSATLIASPPVAELQPGESQVIRVVAENVNELSAERAYRLIIDEIPVERAGGGAGVQTSLRALVPVFITPSTNSRPRVQWTATRVGSDVRITAHNSGDAREHIVNAQVSAGGNALGPRAEGYLLSGATRSWTLPVPAGATSLRITGDGEYGNVEVDVPITG